MTRLVRNCDNDELSPRSNGHLILGYVDEVNGPGAAEVPEFVPTRHELVQLIKYWLKRALDLEFLGFVYQQRSSCEVRLIAFAYRRINRMANCLDQAVTEAACLEVDDEFAQTVDARAWRIFRHGTPEEVAAFHDEVLQELEKADDETPKTDVDHEEAN